MIVYGNASAVNFSFWVFLSIYVLERFSTIETVVVVVVVVAKTTHKNDEEWKLRRKHVSRRKS